MKRSLVLALLLLGVLVPALGGPADAGPVDVHRATSITAHGQRIVGVARYTHRLTLHLGRFSVPDPTVRVQWTVAGQDITGATGRRYTIRPDDVGHRLVAVLTVSAPGYADLRVAVRSPRVRYRVDVRRTVAYSVQTRGHLSAPVGQFEALAQQTYDDARGWRSAGVAFHRVAHGGAFTLVLSQASLVPSFSSECSAQWSCRVGRYVIINQDRWLHASPAWNAAHLGLRDYRDLVVNHETGHWLGLRDIYTCPTPGRPAPVMMEQSKGIGRCLFNPWPLPGEIASRTPRQRHVVDYDRVQVE